MCNDTPTERFVKNYLGIEENKLLNKNDGLQKEGRLGN